MSQANSDIVVDRGKSQFSDLWKKEDYWAIWIGVFLIIVAICLVFSGREGLKKDYDQYVPIIQAEEAKVGNVEITTDEKQIRPLRTIEWYDTVAKQEKVQGQNVPVMKSLLSYIKTPAQWNTNPLDSLYMSKEGADKKNAAIQPDVDKAKAAEAAALDEAKAAQAAASEAGYQDASLNKSAYDAIEAWQKAKKATGDASKKLVKPFNRIPALIVLGLCLGVLVTIGAVVMGFNAGRFFVAFLCVYVLCIIANILGNQADMRKYGANAEIWSIALGMIIANTIGTPKWLQDGAQVEYYIKIGLVLLGADVLFHKLLAIGIPGIFVAWVVTPIVLVTTYIFGQKILKMPSRTLNIVISADMSVCGTSAAIATASAARAKKEELTLSLGLSMTFTAIMMIALPAFIKAVGMPEILGGAWIGGTVDATGAVAAAGAWIGPKALQVAATVKMIQNILIGVTAFCVAIYFTTRVDRAEGEKVGAGEIWNRFPKFVIGFIAVSIIMSFICYWLDGKVVTMGDGIAYPLSDVFVGNGVNKMANTLRTWFFCLAFISIGLTTDFRALAKYFKGGKPVILYVCGQSLNLALTLLMAWIMFYKVFDNITKTI